MNSQNVRPLARPLTSNVSGLRLVEYAGSALIERIAHELSHLDRLAVANDGRGSSAWLEQVTGDRSAVVVTASLDGQLVGYVAGSVADGIIGISRVVVIPAVLAHHDEVLGALIDGYIDSAATPWGDVAIPAQSLALPYLLSLGWRPTTHKETGQDSLYLTGSAVR